MQILKMEKQQNAWSKLTGHARQCVLDDRQELKQYHSKEGNVVLFFNCVHELVGAAFPHEYVACQRFNTAQKVHAEPMITILPILVSWPCSTTSELSIIKRYGVLVAGFSEQMETECI